MTDHSRLKLSKIIQMYYTYDMQVASGWVYYRCNKCKKPVGKPPHGQYKESGLRLHLKTHRRNEKRGFENGNNSR